MTNSSKIERRDEPCGGCGSHLAQLLEGCGVPECCTPYMVCAKCDNIVWQWVPEEVSDGAG